MHTSRLVDPTRHELSAALAWLFSQVAASLTGPVPSLAAPVFRGLEEQDSRPEGVASWTYPIDHRHVRYLAAWWSDALGRKHWVLKAAISLALESTGQGDGSSLGILREDDVDHPLRHIAPPMAFLWRMSGGRREPWVVCRCGLAGTPRSLAWMGASCGPCHDREQDGLPALGHLPMRSDLGPLSHFVLAPDGRLVVLRQGRRANPPGATLAMLVWPPPYVGKPLWRREWSVEESWAVAAGKRQVALLLPGRLTLVSLEDGHTCDSRALEGRMPAATAAFGGLEGSRLLACGGGGLWAWEVRPDGRLGHPLYRERGAQGEGALQVSPLGQRALVSGMSVREVETGRQVERLRLPGCQADFWSFTPEGGVLALGKPMVAGGNPRSSDWVALGRWLPQAAPAGTGLLGWLLKDRPREPGQMVRLDRRFRGPLAISPCGNTFAVAGEGQSLLLGEVATLRELAAYQASSKIEQLAFTSEGLLLTRTEAGLAAYPWRELAGPG
jgi:hypothetical protein